MGRLRAHKSFFQKTLDPRRGAFWRELGALGRNDRISDDRRHDGRNGPGAVGRGNGGGPFDKLRTNGRSDAGAGHSGMGLRRHQV